MRLKHAAITAGARGLAPLLFTLTLAAPAPAPAFAEREAPFEVPDGFRATVYADDDLATDIHVMTLDARGRVVVASTGYVKVLHDDNGDGRADRATRYSDLPERGAQGMAFDGDRLIITGDNSVRVLRDTTGDDVADAEPEHWATLRHPEHGTNGIVKGPDGWFYVITGNDARVTAEHATLATSPITEPDQGALVRISPDGAHSEVLADGLRNPYDLAFNPLGHIFTYDADGERDYHLPWYGPTRMFDLAQGEHHGWVLGGWRKSWNRPESFFDNVERLYEVGRGSPTGVTAYRHRQFPQRYRGGIFAVCWTYGTVYFFPLTPEGSTYTTEMETFVRPTGSAGFAPVAIEVGREGEMYIAIGGRGTRGGVYRIDYVGDDSPAPVAGDPLEQVLQADQPLAAWSRQQWVPLAEQFGREPFAAAAADADRPHEQRIRAVEVLVELFQGVGVAAARAILEAEDPFVTARVAWALSRQPDGDAGAALLADLTRHDHPHVQRAAWEALATRTDLPDEARPAFLRAADSDDRRIRAAAAQAARRAGRHQFEALAGDFNTPRRFLFANHVAGPGEGDARDAFLDRARRAWEGTEDPQLRLTVTRMWQLAMGDIFSDEYSGNIDLGYTAHAPGKLSDASRSRIIASLADVFPSDADELDREIARLLAMLRVADRPDLLESITTRWTRDSHPRDDVHYLIVLAHLGGERSSHVTRRTAQALSHLHGKYRAHDLEPADNWPQHMHALIDRLLDRDPGLAHALTEDEAFGTPDHVLFVNRLDGDDRRRATRRLLARAADAEKSAGWSAEMIRSLTVLPPGEVLPPLRDLWDAEPTHRDAIAAVLARHAKDDDRKRLVAALASMDGGVVARVAEALAASAEEPAVDELVAALQALSRHRRHDQAAPAAVSLLQAWTDQEMDADYEAWRRWFSDAHPDAAARLTLARGADIDGWLERLEQVDWDAGDADRGYAIFQQRLCAACHQASHRLGPDLRNITQRFSREDLFVQIIEPNTAISPLYQAIQITTTDGQVHVGVPVYQSPQATILQTGIDATIRLTGNEIESIEPARSSPMPPNLLEGLTDEQLADFYAYLEQLN